MGRMVFAVVWVGILSACVGKIRPSFMIPMGTRPESTTAPVTNPIEEQEYRPRAEDRAPTSKPVHETARWVATVAGAIGFVLGGAWPALAVDFDETSWLESPVAPAEPPRAEAVSRPDQSATGP